MSERRICIDIQGYWHSGTGQSSGTYLDAMTEKDANGLPFVAGRHLKGLLRHALRRALQWQWLDATLPEGPADSLETLLFGSATQVQSRHATMPGMLVVSDAVLPEHERNYLLQQPALHPHLYQAIYSTAIDENGSAREKSLRGIEVTLPLSLNCRTSLCLTAVAPELRQQQQHWLERDGRWTWLALCLPLIDAVGAHRTRGLGEAILTLQGEETGVCP